MRRLSASWTTACSAIHTPRPGDPATSHRTPSEREGLIFLLGEPPPGPPGPPGPHAATFCAHFPLAWLESDRKLVNRTGEGASGAARRASTSTGRTRLMPTYVCIISYLPPPPTPAPHVTLFTRSGVAVVTAGRPVRQPSHEESISV